MLLSVNEYKQKWRGQIKVTYFKVRPLGELVDQNCLSTPLKLEGRHEDKTRLPQTAILQKKEEDFYFGLHKEKKKRNIK